MKKHEDKDGNAFLHFRCVKLCGFTFEILNKEWGETEKLCPTCSSEIEEFKEACTNMVDLDRRKNWRQGLSPNQQAQVLADDKVDPY